MFTIAGLQWFLLDKSCAVIGDTVHVSANSLVDESVGHLNG
jgi:hypothetical protein